MTPLPRTRWRFIAVGLALLCVAIWLSLGNPVVAQEPGQDHGGFSALTGPFETPQEVTTACLTCHYLSGEEVMGTPHWTMTVTDTVTGEQLGERYIIDNTWIGLPSNEPRCTSCHAGYGYTDSSFFETATETDVDCLVCHASTSTYEKFPAGAGYPVLGETQEFPPGSGTIWGPVDLAAAAQSVGPAGRDNCGSCHFYGGGGDGVKHGDLDSTLVAPSRELDVHMGIDGLDFTCATCHGGQDHQITGSLVNGQAPVECEDCHSGDNAPHQDSEMGAALAQHTDAVACQTCHIPTFAREQATTMSWDWSKAGLKDADGQPVVYTDTAGNVVYDTQRGTLTTEMNGVPTYRWSNGNVSYLTLEDTIEPTQTVTLAGVQGGPGDGKIAPFKRFTGIQPYDAGNNTLVVPNLYPNDAGDTDAYWAAWDWQRAVASGMATAGAEFSGEIGWVDTEMYWSQNHMVAPSEEALTCVDCHTSGGRLDFQALGYEPKRAAFLSTLAEPGGPPPHQNLTRYAGPETCLTCHPDAGRQVAESVHYTWDGVARPTATNDDLLSRMGFDYCGLPGSAGSIAWLNLLQPDDPTQPSQPDGCAQCHVGFGTKPNLPDALTKSDETNVDCLICHGPGYTRTVEDVNGTLHLVAAPGVDILEVVRNVQNPTNEMCQRCHVDAGGGLNEEHGGSLTSPTSDVHLANGLQCIDCHKVEDHHFVGTSDAKGGDDQEPAPSCTDCHDGRHPTGFTAIDMHLDRVACQTCHIPTIARDPDNPTLVATDCTQAAPDDSGLYQSVIRLDTDITPLYRWSNGQMASYPPGPIGSIDDATAKLTPWKAVTAIEPVDAASGDILPIQSDILAVTGNIDEAISQGVEAAGVEYSGSWEPATDQLLLPVNHQVAPAAEALRCADCHTQEQGRLDFVSLGYSEIRAADLVRSAPIGRTPEPSYPAQGSYDSSDARAYVGGLEEALGQRKHDLNVALGIMGGVAAGIVLALIVVILVLRSRGVTITSARGWLQHHRGGVTAMVVLIAGSALVGFVSIHYLLEFTTSTEFCGELCHATRAEYVTYHTSQHANVACAECHVGPGLDQELKAKLNGLSELYFYITNSYERPIPSPVENLRPAREVCEACHWPEVFYTDRSVEIPHFANDEANSRTNTYMLVKIGGGTEREGQGQGIHWHIQNKVEYIATDPQRQTIPWVRAEIDGQTVTYVDVTNPLSEEELSQYEVREMDCIDCHNRASHIFRSTDEILDEAMANGVLPTDLPYLRREAYNALETRDDAAAATTAIEAIPTFYEANYPLVYQAKQDVLADVVQNLKDMYSISHFPEEKVFSDTYPDNLAHLEDPGCFRCHNGKHYAQDGSAQVAGDQSIRLQCNICHTIPQTVAAGQPVPAIPFQPRPQPTSHLSSTWIADHRYAFDNTCTGCHEEETFCANSNCHGRSWPYVNLSVSNPPFPLH